MMKRRAEYLLEFPIWGFMGMIYMIITGLKFVFWLMGIGNMLSMRNGPFLYLNLLIFFFFFLVKIQWGQPRQC